MYGRVVQQYASESNIHLGLITDQTTAIGWLETQSLREFCLPSLRTAEMVISIALLSESSVLAIDYTDQQNLMILELESQ